MLMTRLKHYLKKTLRNSTEENILRGTTGLNTTKPTGFIFYFASYRVEKVSQAKSILLKIYLY